MARLQKQNVKIPVIDIRDSNPNAAQELLDAACKFGFLFVDNNDGGISAKTIDDVFNLSQAFFALPTDIKQEVSISSNKAGKNHGWLSQGVEKLDPAHQKRPDVKEAFNMGVFPLEQPLPDLLKEHFDLLNTFHDACQGLCMRILTLFARALSIPLDWFTTRHDAHRGANSTVSRLLYYPASDPNTSGAATDDDDIRAGAHSDYGSVTCLFRLPGQAGLEIETESGAWTAVPVDPLCTRDSQSKLDTQATPGSLPILVNFGDLLEDWTLGLLKSTVHRVVFPRAGEGAAEDRYSIAYFCHPNDAARLEPVPSQKVEAYAADVAAGKVARRKGGDGTVVRVNGKDEIVTAKDHLMRRLAATYSV